MSAKVTVNAKEQNRDRTSLETKVSVVLRTAPPKLAHTAPASALASTPRDRLRQEAPLNIEDLSAGMEDTRCTLPQQRGTLDERFSLRKLNIGKKAGNSPKPSASTTTRAEGTPQSPLISQNPTTPQPELYAMLEALEQLAFLNTSTGQDTASELTSNQEPPTPPPPQATAPTPPLPLTAARYTRFFVHGAGYSLEFQRHSPDLLIGRLKQEIRHRTSIPVAEQTLSFKGEIMEDTVALRDYNLQQNALNIIDLSIGMSATATPNSAPHTPYPPASPTPAATIAVPPLSAVTNAHTSSVEDATSHSELEQTTTMIFCGRTLDEYSIAALQPELSEVLTALAQLSGMETKTEQTTTPQGSPMSQRQVTWAPTDRQMLDAPPQPTPPQMEMDESFAEEVISAPLAHELPPQAASFDMRRAYASTTALETLISLLPVSLPPSHAVNKHPHDLSDATKRSHRGDSVLCENPKWELSYHARITRHNRRAT